jgi:hypothetical protein
MEQRGQVITTLSCFSDDPLVGAPQLFSNRDIGAVKRHISHVIEQRDLFG